MNTVVIVVDSLRNRSLREQRADRPRTPFLDSLSQQMLSFDRAYSTECWTLPSHMSMFTGLLPSQHGAHFQGMSYRNTAPTLAELLSTAGYATELITRNSLFDGTVPGVTRGFQAIYRPLRQMGRGLEPLLLGLLAIAKPRVRRLISSSGFFHILQKADVNFLTTLARMGLPADELALDCALEGMTHYAARGRSYFLFLNLYDVHAPYSPSPTSPLRPIESPRDLLENLSLPCILPKVASHAYLRRGFRISRNSRRMLRSRYHRAIELMDRKLERFYREALSSRLLDDTLLIITSDHGEAFGEHGLYFHDASVFETNIHVPLWIHHPGISPGTVADPVSTRHLFHLIRALALDHVTQGTILDRGFRQRAPAIAAEHFHYPVTEHTLERYRYNLAGVTVNERKFIRRGESLEMYDLLREPEELHPSRATLSEVRNWCRHNRLSGELQDEVAAHLALGRLAFKRAA